MTFLNACLAKRTHSLLELPSPRHHTLYPHLSRKCIRAVPGPHTTESLFHTTESLLTTESLFHETLGQPIHHPQAADSHLTILGREPGHHPGHGTRLSSFSQWPARGIQSMQQDRELLFSSLSEHGTAVICDSKCHLHSQSFTLQTLGCVPQPCERATMHQTQNHKVRTLNVPLRSAAPRKPSAAGEQ
jgi:hypothetical protein